MYSMSIEKFKSFYSHYISSRGLSNKSTYVRLNGREIKLTLTKRLLFIAKRDDYTCAYCNKKATHVEFKPNPKGSFFPKIIVNSKLFLTEDHVIPRCHNGMDHKKNILTSCNYCNNIKANILPQPSLGYYNTRFKEVVYKNSFDGKSYLGKSIIDVFQRHCVFLIPPDSFISCSYDEFITRKRNCL